MGGIPGWLIWAVMAAIFFIAEMLTLGFFIVCFGVGAVAAALVSYFGLAVIWQWTAFAAFSGLALAFSRKIANRITKDSGKKAGYERVVGSIGVVIEDIDQDAQTGIIRTEDDEWRAVTEDWSKIPKGEHVIVDKISGTKAIVRKKEEKSE